MICKICGGNIIWVIDGWNFWGAISNLECVNCGVSFSEESSQNTIQETIE